MSKYRKEQDKPKEALTWGEAVSGRKESWWSLKAWVPRQGKQMLRLAHVHVLKAKTPFNRSTGYSQIQENIMGNFQGARGTAVPDWGTLHSFGAI